MLTPISQKIRNTKIYVTEDNLKGKELIFLGWNCFF